MGQGKGRKDSIHETDKTPTLTSSPEEDRCCTKSALGSVAAGAEGGVERVSLEMEWISWLARTLPVLPYSVAANSKTLRSSPSSHLRSVSLP